MSLPSRSPLRIGAVVLAAGASTRMGRPKQLLPLQGSPLIVRTVDTLLATPVWPVVVVLGSHAEEIRPLLARRPVIIAENAAWPEGLASSVRSGIETLQQFSRDLDAALFTVCDQPAFSSQIVEKLIAALPAQPHGIAACFYSGRNGVPALLRRNHFATLAALTGDTGARDLLNGNTTDVARVDAPELATDLDTPNDYAAATAI